MKKIICFVLIALMLTAYPLGMVSCSGINASGEAQSEENTNTLESSETTDETRPPLNVPYENYDGMVFRVLARDNGSIFWQTNDFISEEQNGEPINDAVFERNSLISEKFNIKFELQTANYDSLITLSRKAVQSGSDEYSSLLLSIKSSATLAMEKMLENLYDLDYVNIENPWWDTRAAKDFTIAGKLYSIMGDINTTDNDATWAVLFNKKLADNYNLDDHYTVADEGLWTIDKMHQNALAVTSDINGDGEFTPEDQWGAVNQYECMTTLFNSCGGYTVVKDSYDIPQLTMGDDKMVDLLDDILSFEKDGMAQIRADDFIGKYNDIWKEVNVDTFNEGRALYYISPLTSLMSLRDMEDDFGIMVLPKADEKQEEYYSTLQYNNATAYCVPLSISDKQRVGAILEAMAYNSDKLVDAYYETTLKRKYTRDEESAVMLDLIFAGRVIDLGVMFNWGNLADIYYNLPKKSGNFASTYASSETKIIKAMEKTLSAFSE